MNIKKSTRMFRNSEKLLCRICLAVVFIALYQGRVYSAGQKDQQESTKPPTIEVLSRDIITAPREKPFSMPTDAAVGKEGYLYVLDGVNNRVVVFDSEGKFCYQFGEKGIDPGQFRFPLGISTGPDGKVYVADSGNHRIQIFTHDGKQAKTIVLPDVKGGPESDPTDVVVDPLNPRLFIVDNDNHRIDVYSQKNNKFEAPFGGPGLGERQFRFPFLIDVSSKGYMFIVEPINTRVQVLNPDGKFVCFIGAWGIKPGQLFRPKGVAVINGWVFISDSYLGRIQVFEPQGKFLGVLADQTGTPLQFAAPTGVAVDKEKNLVYVVELKANQVSKIKLK